MKLSERIADFREVLIYEINLLERDSDAAYKNGLMETVARCQTGIRICEALLKRINRPISKELFDRMSRKFDSIIRRYYYYDYPTKVAI